MIWPIFIVGATLIVLLHLWYINRKKPFSAGEIDTYLNYFKQHSQQHTDIDVLKKFMLEDDGKEICMANFVSLFKENITHPVTGKTVSPHAAVQNYMKVLLGLCAKKACHPIYVAYRVGGHIDSWGSDDKIDFRGFQMMRYRSRRDFLDLMTNPKLDHGLDIKFAAIAKTITVPAQMQFSTFLRPHVWLSLVILLICCALQIVLTV